MKFDVVVGNPPYDKGLHLKILKKSIEFVDFENNGKIIWLHPGMWIQFPNRKKPLFLDGLIESIEVVFRKNADVLFDTCFANDLVITCLSKYGKTIDKFNCFDYNSRWVENSKIVTDLFKKISSKIVLKSFETHLTAKPQSNFPLRIKYGIPLTDYNAKGGSSKFRIVSFNYDTAIEIKDAGHTRFLNFLDNDSRKNCWNSLLTKFVRFCVCLNETMDFVPFMQDYTEPWTDERFYKYFNLTDDEIKLIEDTIKE